MLSLVASVRSDEKVICCTGASNVLATFQIRDGLAASIALAGTKSLMGIYTGVQGSTDLYKGNARWSLIAAVKSNIRHPPISQDPIFSARRIHEQLTLQPGFFALPQEDRGELIPIIHPQPLPPAQPVVDHAAVSALAAAAAAAAAADEERRAKRKKEKSEKKSKSKDKDKDRKRKTETPDPTPSWDVTNATTTTATASPSQTDTTSQQDSKRRRTASEGV